MVSLYYILYVVCISFRFPLCFKASAAVYGCSIYGFASVLPPIYMQSIGMGQACATLFASITQILSLIFASDAQQSGLVYFIIACLYLGLSLTCFYYLEKTVHMLSYYKLCMPIGYYLTAIFFL
jgi:hypothetical protein